ncbi:hypothetical protein [Streptomyces sp. NPDC059215]|uniref:hypothetical protein n=1 Tax=Streptomyces sp. NPDC059215 TaxID=3346772 RepID=UPI0036AF39CD
MPQPALPGQLTLFAMRRDWSVLTGVDRRRQDLPELTPAARALVVDFDWLMRLQEWHPHTRHLYWRTLMILVSWLGADAPLLESDIYDLERSDPNVAARRLCRFLADRGLLVPDPRRHQDRDQVRVEAAIAMYLVLLHERRGEDKTVWLSPRIGRERYDLSDETRRKGLNELAQHQLVSVRRRPVHQGLFQDHVRSRNVYELKPEDLERRHAGEEPDWF